MLKTGLIPWFSKTPIKTIIGYEDIDGFISKLDKADIVYNRFMEILMKFKVEKKQCVKLLQIYLYPQ